VKNLWAPWRMDYIKTQNSDDQGCIFDQAPDRPYDRENLILLRYGQTVVLLNRYPYANGHLLVAPGRHTGELADLTAEEHAALMRMVADSMTILTKHYAPHGFNVGLNLGTAAGAGLADHLHFHIVPRWEGDHNFMTVLAEIRTIPEHIEQTFDQLLNDFQALAPGTFSDRHE
jgi:ATP adenylyltransferase